MKTAKYDIHAKEGDEMAQRLAKMSLDDRLKMLRTMIKELLSERFGLSVHPDKKEMSVLALEPAKGGVKLQTAKTGDWQAAPGKWLGLHDNGTGHIEARYATMDMLAEHLIHNSEVGGKLVVDRTGMNGKYDFVLDFAPERRDGTAAEGPSLFAALQEQLGLKLSPVKAPVDVVVMDHVAMPSAN